MTLRERKSSRLILIDPAYRVWLLRIEDPARPRWILPGGGVEAGETWEQAAQRELWEECAIDDAAIGPLVATRTYHQVLHGEEILSPERYYLVYLQQQQPAITNMFAYELADYTRQSWMSAGEIRESEEPVYPVGLPDLLDQIAAEGVPSEPIVWA